MSLSSNVDALASRVATEINTVRSEASAHTHHGQVSQSLTASYDIAPAGTSPKVQRYELFASGADRTVTVNAAVKLSTGLSSRTHTVPTGQVLFAAVEYSSFLSAWVLTALTISAA